MILLPGTNYKQLQADCSAEILRGADSNKAVAKRILKASLEQLALIGNCLSFNGGKMNDKVYTGKDLTNGYNFIKKFKRLHKHLLTSKTKSNEQSN